MSNGFDPMAQYARLSERVENQGKDIVDLRSNMNTGFQSVNAAIAGLSNELRSNSKTQWPVIWSAAGVCTAAMVAAGTFVYGTLQSRQDRNDTALTTLAERVVTQKEMEWRTARGAEDRARMENGLKEVRDAQVPRAELDRVFSGFAQQFADQQRQLDDMKQTQAGVYGPRDAIFDLKKELERLRDRSRRAPAVGG